MGCLVQVVNLSGTCLCANVSGDVVNISGQPVLVDVSGLVINISGAIIQISGQAVITDSGSVAGIIGNVVINSGNSTTTTLGSGGIFSGIGISVLGYSQVTTELFTDTSGTLVLQFSPDNVNWDHTYTDLVSPNESVSLHTPVCAEFFKLIYQNGPLPQSFFRLQTMLKPIPSIGIIKDLEEPLLDEDDVLGTHSVITGKVTTGATSGQYIDVKVGPAGALFVNASGVIVYNSGQTILTSVSGDFVTIMGSQLTPAEQDPITHSLVEIGHPHDDIHAGKSYIVSDLVRGIGANSFQKYLVKTSTTVPHMLLSVTGTVGSIVKWIESPTVTSTGIALTTINHSRVSGVSNVTTVFSSGSNYTSGTGTVLEVAEIGGATAGANRFGGASSQDRNENEWNLKISSAVYALEIMSLSADDDISSQFRWYEE